MDKIAILIPCYNEELTIKKVIDDFKKHLSLPTEDVKIYVYDNNSTDDTAKIARENGAIVKKVYKQGKGNVIRKMFQDIDAKCYVLVDGDDTYPASCVNEMAKYILEDDYDMVIGDRLSSTYYLENKRPFHNFGNSLVKNSINYIFKSKIKDIMTGYRAFSYNFVKTFPVLSKGFEVETEMTIHSISMNMAMKNIVIDYKDRPEGSESKLNTFSDGMKVLFTIFNLFRNYKPLEFFSFLSLILILISTIIFIPTILIPYQNTGLVEHFPTLIVLGFVFLTAIISFFNGLILDSIRLKERREFEFRLIISNYMKNRIK